MSQWDPSKKLLELQLVTHQALSAALQQRLPRKHKVLLTEEQNKKLQRIMIQMLKSYCSLIKAAGELSKIYQVLLQEQQ